MCTQGRYHCHAVGGGGGGDRGETSQGYAPYRGRSDLPTSQFAKNDFEGPSTE